MNDNAECSRPSSVGRAVECLWIAAVFEVVTIVLQVVGIVPSANRVVVALGGMVTVAALSLFAIKISTGRGWARCLCIVFYVLGLLLFMVSAVLVPQAFLSFPILLKTSAVVQFVLQTNAFVFLLTSASRQWFRAPHAATTPGTFQ